MITLATLPQATDQEVFDQVANHMLKQGRVSYNKVGEQCAYRAGELSCAAGCLISDEEYDTGMEAIGSWEQMATRGAAPMEHCQLIAELQSAHDRARGMPLERVPDYWRQLLRDVAEEFELETDVLEIDA